MRAQSNLEMLLDMQYTQLQYQAWFKGVRYTIHEVFECSGLKPWPRQT